MKKRAIMRAWAVEIWLNLRYEPWRLAPHLHRPLWSNIEHCWRCFTCGSCSDRVQRKGENRAQALRGRNA